MSRQERRGNKEPWLVSTSKATQCAIPSFNCLDSVEFRYHMALKYPFSQAGGLEVNLWVKARTEL